jgi:DNA-binding MarR family transcriptional regulator
MRAYQEPDDIATARASITAAVGYLVKRVQAALRAAMDDALRPIGLSVSQYAILEALLDADHAESTNAAIARRCFVTPQSASEMIANLTESRLVNRSTCTTVPRMTLALTRRGRRKCLEARKRVLDIEQRMLIGQTETERKQLATLLERCATALEAASTLP